MLINSTLPSLVNGVSQQPAAVRLPSQAESQVNATSSLADGVGKRAPTQHIAKINEASVEWPKVHFIDRDETEKYVAVVQDSRVFVHDLAGGPHDVYSTDSVYEYLTCEKPSRDLVMLTLADTTFVVNKTIEVAMMEDTTPNTTFAAMVTVKAGNYSTLYTVTVDGRPFSLITDADLSVTPKAIHTDLIAATLAKAMKASLPGDQWRVWHREGDSTIWIYRIDGERFSISATDSNANNNIGLVTDVAQRFDELPNPAANNHVVKIAGDFSENADDYWVVFSTHDGSDFGPGVWTETVKPGITYRLDPRTMPHMLVRYQDDTGTITGTAGEIYFRFEQCQWNERIVGDETLSPDPSFVRQRISDIFLHRNRLGVLAGTNVLLSRAGDFFNFFRATAQQVEDADPIDVSVAHPRVAKLRHAVPFNEELLLFGEQSQLILRGGETLTSKSVSIVPATEFTADLTCEPLAAENLVYFPYPNGDYAGVREYFVDSQSNTKDSHPITSHVSRYIPGSIHRLAASTTENVLVALSDEERDAAFIYQWRWNGNEKLQSAWSKWTFGDGAELLGAEFFGPRLYLVFARDCGQYLEAIDVSSKADPDAWYVTHLDRRVDESQTKVRYSPTRDETTFRLPYRPTSTPTVVTRVDGDDETWKPGVLHPVVRVSSDCPDSPPDPDPDEDLDPDPPCVTIVATEPQAYEDGSGDGVFTIYRTGSVAEAMVVNVSVGGTADGDPSGTVDYTLSPAVTDTVTIPAGSSSVSITVTPVDGAADDEGEYVTITLLAADADEYQVCTPSEATVVIIDDDDPVVVGPDPDGPVPASCDLTDFSETIYFTTDTDAVCEGQPTLPAGSYSATKTSACEWGEFLDHGNIAVSLETPGVRWMATITDHALGAPLGYYKTVGESPDGVYTIDAAFSAEENFSSYPTTITVSGAGGETTPPPTAVSSFTAVAVSDTQINLGWTPGGTDETGFEVQRSYNGSTGWTLIAEPTEAATTFSNLGLTRSTTYYYRIRAVNAAGESGWSSVVSATTTGSLPGGNTGTVTLYSTGERLVQASCGWVDQKWTVDGSSAKFHFRTFGTPAWVQNDEDAMWVSHDATSGISDDATTADRRFSTVIDVGGDTDLATLSVGGEFAADDSIEDVLVNGVSTGVTHTGFTELQPFTLSGAGLWRHGPNTVVFVVRNTAGTGNPTGLIVKWATPEATASTAYLRVAEVYADAPAQLEGIYQQKLVTAAASEDVGEVATCECAYEISVRGDLRDRTVYIGMPYTMTYRFTPVMVRKTTPTGGMIADTSGRLSIRTMSVQYAGTGYFQAQVTPRYRDTRTKTFVARKVSNPIVPLGSVPLENGTHRFLVQSKNDQVDVDLVNDSHLPCWFVSAGWEGFYTSRSRGV